MFVVLVAILVIGVLPSQAGIGVSSEVPRFKTGYNLTLDARSQWESVASFSTDWKTAVSLPTDWFYDVGVMTRNLGNVQEAWLMIIHRDQRPSHGYASTKVTLEGQDIDGDKQLDVWHAVIEPDMFGPGANEVQIHFKGKLRKKRLQVIFPLWNWLSNAHVHDAITVHGYQSGQTLTGLSPETLRLLYFNSAKGWMRNTMEIGKIQPATPIAQPQPMPTPTPEPATEPATAGPAELQAMEQSTIPQGSSMGIYLLDGRQETLIEEGSVLFCARSVELVARFPKDTKTLVITFKDKDGNQDVYDETPDGPGVEFITLEPKVVAGIYQLAVKVGNHTTTAYLKVED